MGFRKKKHSFIANEIKIILLKPHLDKQKQLINPIMNFYSTRSATLIAIGSQTTQTKNIRI